MSDRCLLPEATTRCHDCGIAIGPCVCTPQFALFEQAEEARLEAEDEWLSYIETLVGEDA